MAELTWMDVRAARQDIDSLIYDYGEAADHVVLRKWEMDHPGTEDSGDYAPPNRWELQAEAYRQLLSAIREAMSKHSPEIYGALVEAEAEEAEQRAEYAAQNLAKAKAKGFETYEAMQEATLKIRRSASAKKAAATRKERAEVINYNLAARRRQVVVDSLLSGSTTVH
jgi:hypothetical protein